MTDIEDREHFDVFRQFEGGGGFDDTKGKHGDVEDARDRRNKRLSRASALLMDSPDGRFLLREVLEFCGVFQASFSVDGGAMYYGQGQRSVGFYLLTLLQEQDAGNFARLVSKEND